MKPLVKVKFWGTRGSLPRPGPATVRYGGNTSCVQVTAPDGTLLVLDCGSGAYDLGKALQAGSPAPLRGNLLISHTHWDHIQGFPFFAPLFDPQGQWDIYGPAGLGQSLRETLSGQMQYTYFPVNFYELGAKIGFHDLVEGQFDIGKVSITTRYLNHPVLTLGYRLEMDGVVVVYACDHEPYGRVPGTPAPVHEQDLCHSSFLSGADLVIHDSQFTDEEYTRRKGWGHSPVEYVIEMCRLAGVQRVAFAHHDLNRTDEALDHLVAGIRRNLLAEHCPMEVFAAADGQSLSIAVPDHRQPKAGPAVPPGPRAEVSALAQSSVILGISDSSMAALLADAMSVGRVETTHAPDGPAALEMARSAPPTLMILEEELPGLSGLEVCRRLRADPDPRLKELPVIVIAGREASGERLDAGVTGWLVKPFSMQYARAHLHAALMRRTCRWLSAALPSNEGQRLDALHGLSVLDTAFEERFDRITRLAMALAEVPIALVTLVDRERQWFKSCQGLAASETSRELAFCAHVVLERRPIMVMDTLLDDRFADSPIVTGGPRIRFYAGFPLFHANGSCLGTLCLVDVRPRQLPENTLQLLQDLANIVEQELNTHPLPVAGAPFVPLGPVKPSP